MAALSFVSTPNVAPELDSIVFLGTQNALLSDVCAPFHKVLPGSLFTQIVNDLKPSEGLKGPRTTQKVAREGSSTLQSIVLGVVSDRYSRHNAPSRPDQFGTHLNAISLKKKSSLILVVEKASHAFGVACAAAREFPLYSVKTGEKENASVEVSILAVDKQPIDLTRINNAVVGIREAARLVDTPCGDFNASHFVAEAEKRAQEVQAQIKVIRGEDLVKGGFGGIEGVGRAAVEGPALVILSHVPKTPEKSPKTVVLVGKGIVYDTGAPTTMPGMKRDMGGAAAVLHSFVAAVKSNPNINLHALLCIAENAVGPKAIKPDDILRMFSGKTVEVNNTDAEGRLVLADGVAYGIKEFHPDLLLDMATLTGAQGNDDEVELKAIAAGKSSGDLVHPLIYCPESEFDSEMADMKNSVKNRGNAQSSCAAQFIANHFGDYANPWIHVDMAAPAHNGERATGYGVALILEILQNYA